MDDFAHGGIFGLFAKIFQTVDCHAEGFPRADCAADCGTRRRRAVRAGRLRSGRGGSGSRRRGCLKPPKSAKMLDICGGFTLDGRKKGEYDCAITLHSGNATPRQSGFFASAAKYKSLIFSKVWISRLGNASQRRVERTNTIPGREISSADYVR